MSANSGCGGFYYCRQQRSECVDRPSGSRNTHTHTHTYHCRWSSLGLRPNAYCRFIDKYLSLLLSHGLMTGQLYLHPWGGDPIWGPCINIYNLLFPPPCKSAHICLHFQFISLCCWEINTS